MFYDRAGNVWYSCLTLNNYTLVIMNYTDNTLCLKIGPNQHESRYTRNPLHPLHHHYLPLVNIFENYNLLHCSIHNAIIIAKIVIITITHNVLSFLRSFMRVHYANTQCEPYLFATDNSTVIMQQCI